MNIRIKRHWFAIMGLSAFLFVLIGGIAFADDSNTIWNAVISGKIDTVVNHLDVFKLYHEKTGITDVSANVFNIISDVLWGITTLTYVIFDRLIQLAFSGDVMVSILEFATNIASQLFSNLQSTLLTLVGMIGIMAAFFVFAFKSEREGAKQLVYLFLVMIASLGWFSIMKPVLTTVDNVSTSVATSALQATSRVKPDGKSNIDLSEFSTAINNQSAASNTIRVWYFNQSIFPLWKIANFGSDEVPESLYKQFLTSDKSPSDVTKIVEKNIDGNTGTYVKFMKKDNANYQVMLSMFSWIVIVAYGLPYVGLGIINFFLVILIAIVVIGMPILAILSFLPAFRSRLYNGISDVLKLVFFKSAVLFGLVIFAVSNAIVSFVVNVGAVSKAAMSAGGSFAGFVTFGAVLIKAVLFYVLLYLVFKNRQFLLKYFTGSPVDIKGADKAGEIVGNSANNLKEISTAVLLGALGKEFDLDVFGHTFHKDLKSESPEYDDTPDFDDETDYDDTEDSPESGENELGEETMEAEEDSETDDEFDQEPDLYDELYDSTDDTLSGETEPESDMETSGDEVGSDADVEYDDQTTSESIDDTPSDELTDFETEQNFVGNNMTNDTDRIETANDHENVHDAGSLNSDLQNEETLPTVESVLDADLDYKNDEYEERKE